MDGEHRELQQNGRSHNGHASSGQQPPQVTPPPPNQQSTSTGDLLRQCEQLVALLQQRQQISSSVCQRRRENSIGNPDQQQLSGHPAGGQRPSGQSPTISSIPPGRQRPPTDDDLLLQCGKMMALIVQQRQAHLNPCIAMAHNAIQPDAIINQTAIIKQQIRDHGESTALAPSAVKAVSTPVNQQQQSCEHSGSPARAPSAVQAINTSANQQLAGESMIDQHYRQQQAPGGPQQLLRCGLSGSSIQSSLQRGTFGCHLAVPASIVHRPHKAFSHQQLSHSMEVERCHHFATINAHRVQLHFSRLPPEVTSGPFHPNGPRIEAHTHCVSAVEPAAHHLSAPKQQKGTDSTARLPAPTTPASTAIQCVPFERPVQPTVLISDIGHQSAGAELANCNADSNGTHPTTAHSQHVVKSYREGRGATGNLVITFPRVLQGTPDQLSEVCPNFLPSTGGPNKRKSSNEMRDRVDVQPSSGHPSWAVNNQLPADNLNEWQLPRPPQTVPSPSADVCTPTLSSDGESTTQQSSVALASSSTPGREPASDQRASASAGASTPEPPSSPCPSTSTFFNSGSMAKSPSVVDQPHRYSWPMRASQKG